MPIRFPLDAKWVFQYMGLELRAEITRRYAFLLFGELYYLWRNIDKQDSPKLSLENSNILEMFWKEKRQKEAAS